MVSLILLITIGKFGYEYLSGNYMLVGTENEKGSEQVKKAPDFQVYTESGEVVRLSDFKGKKPVVINIWASWCGPCKKEMPYFQKAIKEYGDDVEVLMINLTDGKRETKEKALKYLNENNLDIEVLFDEKLSATNAYFVQSIPRTIFIDIDGNIVKDNIGLIAEETLNGYIKKLIK